MPFIHACPIGPVNSHQYLRKVVVMKATRYHHMGMLAYAALGLHEDMDKMASDEIFLVRREELSPQ